MAEKPELLNEDPYGEGWLVRVKLSDPSEVDELMDAAAYRAMLADDSGSAARPLAGWAAPPAASIMAEVGRA